MAKTREPRRLRALRWADDEWAAVQVAAADRGLTASEYVRRAALGRADVTRDDRRALLRQLRGLGNNLNQLTKAAHLGKIREADPGEWQRLRIELEAALARIL